MSAAWAAAIEPELVDRRFGVEAVNAALASSRLYVDPPAMEASRIVAVIVDAPGGKRLSTPLKVAVRLQDERLDVSCACRHVRVCEHVVWLLVDIAFHPALRAALVGDTSAAPYVAALPALRARALEERTLDERLAHWLPARSFDDDLEIDVDVVTPPTAAAAEARSAILLRHRRPTTRSLMPARDVLALRLGARHRRLVELTAPYHLDRNALVATRGQASLLVHFLRAEIGPYANGYRARVRFSDAAVGPRIERMDDRLIARWFSAAGELVADAEQSFVVAGPFPYLWVPASCTFHPVLASVDLDAAIGMQRVPSLPIDPSSAERVGRTLLGGGRGLGVMFPSPDVFGLPPLEAPSFELRLTGSPLEVRGELFAVYSAGKMRIGADRALDGRDLDAEDHGLALVRAAGLDGDGSALVASEERAVVFWQNLAELRASTTPPFVVLLAEALSRVKIGASPLPDLRVDVRVATTAGWLETQLEFRAASLTVEIERLHEALAASRRFVVLSDGSLARITDDVLALVAETSALGLTRGAGRLPPHQFGRVARWIELADSVTTSDAAIRLHVDPSVVAMRGRIRELLAHPTTSLPSRLEATLRPYQSAGVAWLQVLRELGAGGLLADDMGLGKTIMTLAFLARWKEDAGAQPTLVVCPTSVVGNWIREAARFTPGLRVTAWLGGDRRAVAIDDHDLVVTTYGLLRRDASLLAETRFRCVVLDEAQNIKNPASATARAARRLDAQMRVALTGTPVENRLSELWSLMTFANPGMLGTAADFDRRYERPIGQRPDGATASELRAVVRPFVLRRTKAEVLAELPVKTEIERTCVFGLRQKRLYDALAIAIRQAVSKDEGQRKNARTRLSVLTGILRLRQMACDPRLVDARAWSTFGGAFPGAGSVGALGDGESAKLAAFLDLVREIVASGRRALVFSQFVELLALWRQELDRAKVAYEYLDGSTTNRDAVVDRFQRGTAPLFLISLKAGGAGLNLTEADTVIHCDPWWNPAAENQATDRAHRIGQSRPVTVVRLVARGTIEDKIALLKSKKEELSLAIIGATGDDASSGLDALGEDDLAQLLGDHEGDPDGEADEVA